MSSPRSVSRLRAFAVLAAVVGLSTMALAVGAGADGRAGDPAGTPTAQASAAAPALVAGPADTGPMVPALLGLTAAMLVVGTALLWVQCRNRARPATTHSA